MPIYVEFMQGNVNAAPGKVTAKGHVGWTELSSAQLGRTQTPGGSGTGRQDPAATGVNDAYFGLSATDQAVPQLLASMSYGKPFDKVIVDFVNAAGETYLTWTLESSVYIGTLSVAEANGNPNASASFSLAFGKVKVERKQGAQPEPAFDLATQTVR